MNDLESAVFESVYNSGEQRRFRMIAMLLLSIKHGLRGIMFSWPLYFIGVAPFVIPSDKGWWLALFIIPALIVSGYILLTGIREERDEYVTNQILDTDKLKQMLVGSPR